jgi:rhodanese-related sulfurtransferase
MDQTAPTILPDELNSLLGAASVLVDLRSADQIAERLIPGAIRRSPADVQAWWSDLVRGADTSRHDLAQQCGGLVAISLGLSANFLDDHEILEHGIIVYDAIYSWCRSRPPAGAGGRHD